MWWLIFPFCVSVIDCIVAAHRCACLLSWCRQTQELPPERAITSGLLSLLSRSPMVTDIADGSGAAGAGAASAPDDTALHAPPVIVAAPVRALVLVVKSAYHRLLIHGVCQFRGLTSVTVKSRGGGGGTGEDVEMCVTHTRRTASVPALSLMDHLAALAAASPVAPSVSAGSSCGPLTAVRGGGDSDWVVV